MAKLFPKLVSFIAVLLLCQFGYVVCQSTNSSDSPQLPEDEAKALDELMTTLRWNTSQQISRSSCDDKGISCSWSYDQNSTVYHVTGLHLSSRELKGQIDAEALASLVHLEQIDLSSNQLHGSIPVAMGNLRSLTSLDLSYNQLDGSIPFTLGNLSSLTYLDLSDNQLHGSIPDFTMGNLSSLTYLDLSYNQLDGSIPDVTMGNLRSLNYLDLSTNFLKGSIPSSLGNLSSLLYLRLSRNFLDGSIPSSLGNLSSLRYLILWYNMLSGEIPKELGTLSHLRSMVLGFNELTGQLPPELGRLGSLYALELSSNNLTGELPENYANFTLGQLEIFSVAGNRLTGKVPRFIANWTELSYLFLSGNDFEGELPLEPLFNMSKLERLYVSDVRSSTGFPFPEYANMTAIRYLVIRNCSISGEIPRYIGDWSSLKYLDLSFNNLTGGIPDSMKKLKLSKMFLTGNMLNGTVPSWVTDNIEDKADLSYNNFEIPRDGPKKGERKLNIEPYRNSIRDLKDKCQGKPKYDSLYINCGEEKAIVDGKCLKKTVQH
nr:LRR receptor-like serine/threonine-protein kinase GSO1 [Populus alba]